MIYRSLPQITGTATDDFTGVKDVQVQIQNLNTGNYWKGGSWASGTGTDWFDYTGGNPVTYAGAIISTWTYGNPPTLFTQTESGYNFMVLSRGIDNAINTGQTFSVGVTSIAFAYDVTAPTSTVNYPVNAGNYSALLTISGTANDVAPFANAVMSGVGSVKISINDIASGTTYWNDTSRSWTNSTFWNSTVYNSSTWTFTFSNPSLLPWQTGKQYLIRSKAIDQAVPGGNDQDTQYPQGGYVITYDTNPPLVQIGAPQNNGFYGPASSALVAITGTAVDLPALPLICADINNIQLQIYNGSKYWSGSSWVVQSTWVPTQYSAGFWQYPGSLGGQAIPVWQDQTQYSITAQAMDNAGNNSSPLAYTITYDSTPPVSVISYPSTRYTNVNIATISGTTTDPNPINSKPNQTFLSLQLQGGSWWSWGAQSFSLSNASWTVVNGGNSSQSGWTQSWNLPSWQTDNTYVIYSSATDRAGNQQVVVSSFVFSYDITKPTATVTTPASFGYYSTMAAIAGTTFDATSGVQTARINIKSGTSYWNGSSGWDITGAIDWLVVSGTANWNYTNVPSWVSGTTYYITPWTLDFAGNDSTGNVMGFVFDNTAPASYISPLPVNGRYYSSLPTISGTSIDPLGTGGSASGVNKTQVSIYSWSKNAYWDGLGSFGNASQTPLPTFGTATNWQYSIGSSYLVDGTSYTVQSQATDNAQPANVESIYTAGQNQNLFIYDVSNPTSVVTCPLDGSNDISLATISGTQMDIAPAAGRLASGVGQVMVSIQDLTYPTTYWNGSSWQNSAEYFNPTNVYQSSWTYSSVPAWQTGRRYKIRSRAYDNAYPTPNDQYNSYPQGGYTILFDTIPPTVSVVQPQNQGYYGPNNTLPTLSGQVQDYPSLPWAKSGVKNVVVNIQQVGGNWWNGTSFGVSTTTWRATQLQGSADPYTWLYPGNTGDNTPTWADNTQYTVTAAALDNAGNFSMLVISTFTWDRTAPTSLIQLPSRTYYKSGSLSVLSGTASDGANVNRSGLLNVGVAIQQNPAGGGNWWSWGAQSFSLSAASYTLTNAGTLANWQQTWNLPPWNNFDGQTFKVCAMAEDNALNFQTPVSSSAFTYDISNPTGVVTLPAPGITYYSSLQNNFRYGI